jgi:phage/plasmid-associated DNA primase
MFHLPSIASSLQNIVLREKISVLQLDQLLDCGHPIVQAKFSDEIRQKLYPNGERLQFVRYRQNVTNGFASVKYVRSGDYGRVLPQFSLGLHNIRREVRQTLASPDVVDIDQVMSHPYILEQKCQQNNVNCEFLSEYIRDRPRIVDETMHHCQCTKDECKNGFIAMINGGKARNQFGLPEKEIKPSAFMMNFERELRAIGQMICDQNPEIRMHVEERQTHALDLSVKDDRDALRRGVVANYLMELEQRSLEQMFLCYQRIMSSYFSNPLDYNIVSLCADGIMLPGQHLAMHPSLLEDMQNAVFTHLGFHVRLAIKPFTQRYTPEDIAKYTIVKCREIHDKMQYHLNKIATANLHEFMHRTNEVNACNVILDILGRNKYVCVGNKVFYTFENHRWILSDKPQLLRDAFTKVCVPALQNQFIQPLLELLEQFKPAVQAMLDEAAACKKGQPYVPTNPELYEKYTYIEKIVKMCEKFQVQLGATSDRDNFMKELSNMIYDPSFESKLDKNPMLLCCANGIVDLEQKCLRDGNPEDMCSLCTNVNYIPMDSHEIQDRVIEFDTFLRQMFVDPSMFKFAREYIGALVSGARQGEEFYMFKGTGSNAKSLFHDMIRNALGTYSGPVSLNVVCGKTPEAGQCSPDHFALRGIRLGVMQEPEKNSKFNEHSFKMCATKEAFNVRALYGTPIQIRFIGVLVLLTNVFVGVTSFDEGFWRRMKLVPCFSEFLDEQKYQVKVDTDTLTEYTFKKDRSLKDKIDSGIYNEAVLSYMVRMHFEYNGIIESCPLVEKYTHDYRISQDRIFQFIQAMIIPAKGEKISKTELGNHIRDWFMNMYKYPINNKEVFDHLEKNLGYDCTGTYVFGLKIRIVDEDDASVETNHDELLAEQFKCDFEVTRNPEDFVKTIEILEWAKLQNLQVQNSRGINKILLEYFQLDSKHKDTYKKKKIEGESAWCWIGIKKIERKSAGGGGGGKRQKL